MSLSFKLNRFIVILPLITAVLIFINIILQKFLNDEVVKIIFSYSDEETIALDFQDSETENSNIRWYNEPIFINVSYELNSLKSKTF